MRWRARDEKGGVITAREEGLGDGESGALAKRSVCRRSKNVFATLTGLEGWVLPLRAEYGGGIERMGRLLIQVAGNW